jgi:hypothetical protein
MIDNWTISELDRLLESHLSLRYRTVIPVLGMPVTFEADAAEVITLAEESFGAWRSLESTPEWIAPVGPTIRVVVRRGSEGSDSHASLRHDLPRQGYMTITTPGSRAIADSECNGAAAVVTETLVADRSHFRYGVLEALAFFLLSWQDRQPIHAAALSREGKAVLLAGPSGVGKSTLAYAGLRIGLQVLAEDVVYLQSRPQLRVWGTPGFLHLPPDSARYFPELAERQPTLRANGKMKIAIDVRAVGAVPPLPVVDRVTVCLLRRGGSGPGLQELAATEVEQALVTDIEPGFDMFAETIGPVVRKVVQSAMGWQLDLTDHPQTAVEYLRRVLDELDDLQELP